ncbi:ATP-binding protein [Streptomyces sp. NPDC007088]|uniref:ATP-binding protein n=1 Tax=Streptomyces sp. NPDC007088 TaxID=3364773 RepID=UPI0036A06BC3
MTANAQDGQDGRDAHGRHAHDSGGDQAPHPGEDGATGHEGCPAATTGAAGRLWEREAELALVERALDSLCEDSVSRGSLLVFSGEAGIGKTALLEEVRRRAAGRATVWSARGGETVTSVPFNVVRQLLANALVSITPEEARDYLGDRYEIVGPALGIVEPGDRRVDPQGVRDGLVEAVSRLADMSWPLVLLIDDAHWADLETLTWLASFAEHLDDVQVLVVVTLRDTDATGQVAELLGRITDAARPRRAALRPLGPQAAAELTRSALGPLAEDGFCREVWAVTGGNPYETVELLAKARESGLRPVESAAGDLRALNTASRGDGLVARLDELGPQATQFAWAAAVLGTGITLELAALVHYQPLSEARGHVARLRAARVLSGPDEDLQFVHPLVASAIYQSIPVGLRAALHSRAATLVLDDGRGHAAASRHLLEVHPEDDPDIVTALREAAREHLAVGAPAAARRCLERALREPPPPESHAHVLYELGCSTLLTEPATTVKYLRAALELPEGLDPDLRVDAVCRLSQALVHLDQLREAVRCVDEEAARIPRGPARMRLQGVHYMWEGIFAREADAEGRSQGLAALAEPLAGRDTSERALLILRAFDVMARGESAEHAVELCDRALVNGRLAPGLSWTDTEWSFELLVMLGGAYVFSDRLDRAESLFTEGLRAYEDHGWSGAHLAVTHAFVGYVHRRRGRLIQAVAYLREALRLAERVGSRLPMHWDIVCMLVDALLARGQVAEAEEVMEQHSFHSPYPDVIVLPDAAAVRGRLLLALGRHKEAVEELEAGIGALAARGWHNTVMAPVHGELAAALARSDPGRAAELAATARRDAERFGTDTAIGEALRQAATAERGQRSVTLLAQAVTYLETSPCAYEHARARVQYGAAVRSVAELRRGLTLARACGADGLVRLASRTLEDGRGLS